ncbi:hypothetical protein JCM19275_1443 [Nonlabens ulvanivorans]|uniref:Uncharacterized protein n=1 Tax=Nonlabens ulvanivorans TaxID=906888 RepID=A0A090QEG0_NONUL|nr:hypothetical protein JCM19314_770 [Nonlabens ulvanivorans]GAL76836.1 hypothetical protein JCM19275_1443 [Nonlabens ulvanivorans]
MAVFLCLKVNIFKYNKLQESVYICTPFKIVMMVYLAFAKAQ